MQAALATFLRFAAVGVVNTAVSFITFMAVLAVLPPFSGRAALAQVPAYGVGMATSFLLNRMWTFASGRDATSARDGTSARGGTSASAGAGPGAGLARRQAGRFLVTQVACLALTAGGLGVAIDWFGLLAMPSWLAVSLGVILLNFAAQRLWVFAPAPVAHE